MDCVLTEWSEWSPCSVTCGAGSQTADREIVTAGEFGGQACPEGPYSLTQQCVNDDCTGMYTSYDITLSHWNL